MSAPGLTLRYHTRLLTRTCASPLLRTTSNRWKTASTSTIVNPPSRSAPPGPESVAASNSIDVSTLLPDDTALDQLYSSGVMSLNASECRQCLQSLLSVLDAHARESRALDECASLGERVQMRAGSTSEATSFHFEAYRAILTGDPLLADLEQALGGCSSSENVQRDLTALGNLVFQYATSSKSVAFWLWELGLRADERNALYSYAQVLRETDNAGSLTSLVSSMFERASALGHPYATYSIGLMASTGELPGGVNLHKAREYFEKAVEMEVPLAYTNLAHMHRLGLGMPHADMRRALELYQKAATLGDPKAKLVLAGIHAQGVVIDDVQDPTRKFILLSPNIHRAFDLWHEAASVAQQPAALTDANPTSFIADPETASQSLVCLGNCYFLGVGLPETRPAMREVDAFDVKPDVEVTGVPQPLAYGRPSYHVALKFWEMAAEADPANLQAWLHIGNMHMDGVGGAQHGVEQNYYKAVYYYDRLLEEARRIGAWPTLNSNEELQQAASAHPARDMCHIAQGLLEHCQNQIIQVSGPDAAHATARAPATMDTPRESTASLYNRLQTSRAASPSATTATASAPRSSLQTMLDLFADIDRARRQSQSTPFLRRLLNPFKARQAVSNAIKSGDGEIGEVEAKTSIDGARLQRDSRRVHWRYLDDFVGMLEGATNRPQ